MLCVFVAAQSSLIFYFIFSAHPDHKFVFLVNIAFYSTTVFIRPENSLILTDVTTATAFNQLCRFKSLTHALSPTNIIPTL